MRLPPCTCGGLVESIQTGPESWALRCTRCSALVVGATEHDVGIRWERGVTVLREQDMSKLKFTAGEIRECCKDPGNLVFHSRRYDLTAYVCRVCGRKHLKMWAEPGVVGLRK